MRGIIHEWPDNPDFPRVVSVAHLRRTADFAFEVAPEAREAEALARLLDARSVRKMRFVGTLRPEGKGWALEGELGATVVQTCVVTLEPVTTRVDLPVRRRFVPMADRAEVEVSPDEDDALEPLGDRIDLGLVATEALALALPAYPRKDHALPAEVAVSPPGAEPAGVREKPFASLAALRERMTKEE
jgi:uncharacterized metal-binding protein YceD (DUF177 family)